MQAVAGEGPSEIATFGDTRDGGVGGIMYGIEGYYA